MVRSLARILSAIPVLLGLASPGASAQEFPSRPISIIVPVVPGGGTDYIARVLAREMTAVLGKPVVVENRPGAGGNVGTNAVARSPKDGHTLLLGFGAPLTTNVSLYGAALPYDPLRDLEPVSLVAESPEFLLVHPGVPASNVAEFVALAKANPGRYQFASGGTGTVMHLAGELLKLRASIDMQHIPYKGEGAALPDVLSGRVPVIFGTAAAIPHFKAGKLRALAVTSSARSGHAPEVPTFHESGYPGYDITAWYAVMAPAGIPRPVFARLQTLVTEVVESKPTVEALAKHGLTPVGGGPEKLAARIRAEIPLMAELVKAAGLKP